MQNVNRGHSAGKRKRGKKTEDKPETAEVTTVTVDPALRSRWQADRNRTLVLASDVLLVCNSERHLAYMRKLLTDG